MNTSSITNFMKSVQLKASKHSPEILTGIGIAGMITTTVMAVRATPKALDLMTDIRNRTDKEHLDKKEQGKLIVTKVAPVYIPSVIVGGMSIACLIGATSVSTRRTAALATAYSLSESALKEYQEKVIETIGDRKEQGIRDSIAKDKMDRTPINNTEIIVTGGGKTIFFDPLSSRYFEGNLETIKQVFNKLNHRLLSEMYISLNEFYYEIGLSSTTMGDDMGWNVDVGLIEPSFRPQLITDEGRYNGEPCIVLEYFVGPRYDYRHLM